MIDLLVELPQTDHVVPPDVTLKSVLWGNVSCIPCIQEHGTVHDATHRQPSSESMDYYGDKVVRGKQIRRPFQSTTNCRRMFT